MVNAGGERLDKMQARVGKLFLTTAMASALAIAATDQARAWSYKEAAEPYKGTTIQILDEITPLQETFATMVPMFEEETGIKVEYELLNHFEVINRGQADLLSGSGKWDAVMNHGFQLGLLIDAEVLRPIDDLMADEALMNPNLDTGDLIEPAFSSLSSFGDQTYGFVNWNYNQVYWARNDLLTHPDEMAAFKESYGYDLAPAETIQQMKDIAAFFTRKSGEMLAGETLDGDFFGIVMEGVRGGSTFQNVWTNFIRNHGGDIFDAEGKPTLDSAEVIAGLSNWADLWEYSPPGQAEYSLLDVPTVMGNGIAAQSIAWSDFVLGVDREGSSPLAGQFVYAPIPGNADFDGPRHAEAEPSAINMSVHTDAPEATFLFMQWMIEKATQVELLAKGDGGVPIRNSSWDLPILTESELATLFDGMKGTLSVAVAKPKMPNYLEIADALNATFQQVGIGELTPEEGAKAAQEQVLSICEDCTL